MTYCRFFVLTLLVTLFFVVAGPTAAANTTYYVANGGSDSNNGLSLATAFATIGKVNTLNLQPGDKVLFQCGDTWRGEMLVITRSGTAGSPITFGSYPENCPNRPILSGAQPINGWSQHATNIYKATVASSTFPHGLNQLFRNEQRLPMGRWPNPDAANSGYATISAQPAGNQITGSGLPIKNWTGAVAHIKGMRWYILNRQVTGASGQTLTLGASAGCWGGSCLGWGFFLNNHLETLDREGEWYYNAATRQIYLYTTGGAPAAGQVEGSAILKNDTRSWGGVVLGEDLGDEIAYVVVENLELRRWFRHGIATPTNLANRENHDLILRNNMIRDVDSTGINLATWVYDPQDGRPAGWRGGYNQTISGNTIDTANHMSINTYSRQSSFTDNIIRAVGLIENLGAAGMGCDFDDGEGQCTEDGDGIRVKVGLANDSGNYNTFSGNRLERIAYNGIDVFGHHNTFTRNFIDRACYAKGDCGGVRTFGNSSLTNTPVHNLTFQQNIILDTTGNTDGCHSTYIELFGFGLYIDHYSRDITITGNTIISSTVHGILYANSTGSVTDNTLYNNSRTWPYDGGQLYVGGSPAYVATHQGNILFGLNSNARTLAANDAGRLGTSDSNAFFNPYQAQHIRAASVNRSLASWQSYSGKDAHSTGAWYSQVAGQPPRSRIFYNDTAAPKDFDLGDRAYLDLNQQPVIGSLTLASFTSQILIDNGPANLTLTGISPRFWGADEAQAFTLTVSGAKFTASSVVRWNGSARPTTFISSSELRAAITAGDVGSLGDVLVKVYDPTQTPNETTSLTFKVVSSVSRVYLPVLLK